MKPYSNHSSRTSRFMSYIQDVSEFHIQHSRKIEKTKSKWAHLIIIEHFQLKYGFWLYLQLQCLYLIKILNEISYLFKGFNPKYNISLCIREKKKALTIGLKSIHRNIMLKHDIKQFKMLRYWHRLALILHSQQMFFFYVLLKNG